MMINKSSNTVTVGLIRGRHEMPVSEFIFEPIENVLDFLGMRETIMSFLESRVGIYIAQQEVPLNSADGTDIACYKGEKSLVVYVTGLTAVTAELVACCAYNGIDLTLMHYNSEKNEYVPQKLFWS